MTNNRNWVDDTTVLKPAMVLDKGLPLPFLDGRLRVDEGWCAVITVGGAFQEILPPGTHFTRNYHFFRDVLAALVDTRVQTLTITTKDEFTIAQPVPVKINLDLAVEYRITDARRVATEVKTPLTNLYDRVLQCVRSVVAHVSYDEFRTQGEAIARHTLQRLQALNLPGVLGMEVLNVLVTSITGADAIAQQHIKEYTTVRTWQLDTAMISGTQITPQWLLVNRPEIYQQLLSGNTTILKELIDKGLLDPASFLQQAAGSLPSNISTLLGQMTGGGFSGLLGMGNPNTSPHTTPMGGFSPGGVAGPALPNPQPPASIPSDPMKRIREDLDYLRKYVSTIPNARAVAHAVADQSTNLPDGSYMFVVEMVGGKGSDQRQLRVCLACDQGYPNQAPQVEIFENEQAIDYESPVLGRWTSNTYLIEIVREIKSYYG